MAISRRSQQALDSEGAGGTFDPETWREDIEAWWKAHGEAFIRRLVRVKVDAQHVDDLSQSITFELMRTLERGSYEHRSQAEFRGFVRQIVRRQIAHFYEGGTQENSREISVEEMPPQFEIADPDTDLDTRLEQAYWRKLFRPLLNRLTPRRRQIIHLTYWEELGHAEIAERLNISADLVRQDKRRALLALRDALTTAYPDLAI